MSFWIFLHVTKTLSVASVSSKSYRIIKATVSRTVEPPLQDHPKYHMKIQRSLTRVEPQRPFWVTTPSSAMLPLKVHYSLCYRGTYVANTDQTTVKWSFMRGHSNYITFTQSCKISRERLQEVVVKESFQPQGFGWEKLVVLEKWTLMEGGRIWRFDRIHFSKCS